MYVFMSLDSIFDQYLAIDQTPFQFMANLSRGSFSDAHRITHVLLETAALTASMKLISAPKCKMTV